jgi:xanthosine utilization system XapX-like protein
MSHSYVRTVGLGRHRICRAFLRAKGDLSASATNVITELIGLFGMVLGQQTVDMAKRYLAPTAQTSIQRKVGGGQVRPDRTSAMRVRDESTSERQLAVAPASPIVVQSSEAARLSQW